MTGPTAPSSGGPPAPVARPQAPADVRGEFVAALPFPLDRFQIEALDLIDRGKSVLVAAPTGSGKTVVAEYAVAQALAGGGRAFYTTPLKALSNQKYADFVRAYGEASVGLLTGDISRNPGARIVVMTTEVLRNMIYADPERLDALSCVVLDEVHYLEDPYRGSVWEEIIISAPEHIGLVCLSATVSNAEELASWIGTVRGGAGAVIEERRPIELRNLYIVGDRIDQQIHLLPTFVDGRPNPEAAALDARIERAARRGATSRGGSHDRRSAPRRRSDHYRPARPELVERFAADDLLPAIYFVFSRAGCDDAVRQCLAAGIRLTNGAECREIRSVADAHVEGLSDRDLEVLGYLRFRHALEAGVAAHHAGLVPPFREAVEALFSRALVKVVFATETLALGINMPARSVVIEAISKFGGAGHQDLTPGEYTQLTGRAGRRGIDKVGYAGVVFSPFHTFGEVASLATARSRPLRSAFRPTYNMVANLVRRYDRDNAYRLVRSSFAQYLSEQPLTRQLDAVIGLLTQRGYLDGWQLTTDGERLAGLYHDCDLLLAEAIAEGLFDGLDLADLVAITSLFTFEARREGANAPLPNAKVVRRHARLEELAAGLRADERASGLPRTRQLDTGFAALAHEWARGSDLTRLLLPTSSRRRGGRLEPVMSGGDFVRNVKQLVDLLRQLGATAGGKAFGTVATSAAEELVRGIVAASVGLTMTAPGQVADDPR